MQGHLDRVLEGVRDRPGSAILISCAGAAFAGFIAGRLLYNTTTNEADDGEKPDGGTGTHRESRQTTESIPESIGRRLTDDSVRTSGASTPVSSISGTPRRSLANELSGEIDTLFVIVFRTDLQMGKGRLTTLSCQAAIAQYKQLYKSRDPELKLWERSGRSKVCLQCTGEKQLLDLQGAANSRGLKTFKVKDTIDGHSHIAVLAIGPAKSSVLKEITQNLAQQV